MNEGRERNLEGPALLMYYDHVTLGSDMARASSFGFAQGVRQRTRVFGEFSISDSKTL